VMATPPGVSACRRVSPAGREIVILTNHTRSTQHVPLPWAASERLGGRDYSGEIELEPFGVAVLTRRVVGTGGGTS